jgi:fibronectin-binding autotransporter adhesin
MNCEIPHPTLSMFNRSIQTKTMKTDILKKQGHLSRTLTAFVATLVALLLACPKTEAANGTPYYIDFNGTTGGFGTSVGASSIADNAAIWSSSSAGTATPATWTTTGQMTIGASASDFAGESFTINLNSSGNINGFVVNSGSATVTLAGSANESINAIVTNTVATGSTLIWNNTRNSTVNIGLNMNNKAVTFEGGGTNTFITHLGANCGAGGGVNNNGSTINLNYGATAGSEGSGSATVGYCYGFTNTAGTLNFQSANSADAFTHFITGHPFAIKGGTIDNISGSPLVLAVGSGGYSFGGDFTFTGGSDLDFSPFPVDLGSAVRQITVNGSTLTLGGVISGTSTAGLTKAGNNGALTLSGANTYPGKTSITGGTLNISADGNLGAVPGSTVADQLILDGGILHFGASISTISSLGTQTSTGATIPTATLNNSPSGTAVVKASNGILSLTGGTGGSGLTAVTVNIPPPDLPGGVQAVASATLGSGGTAGQVIGYTVTTAGSGYSYAPTITLTKTGTTAPSAPTVGSWTFLGLKIMNYGMDLPASYTPTVTLTGVGTTGPSITTTLSTLALDSKRGITLNSGGGTFDNPSSYSAAIGGIITGTGSLTKTGTGTLTLNNANTYSGDTTISTGTLALGSSASLASTNIIVNGTFDVSAVSSGYHLTTGKTLKGTGTVTGPVTVDSGATLTVGGSTGTTMGTLTVNGGLTLSGNTTLRLNKGGSTTSDLINKSSGALAFGGTLTLSSVGSTLAANDQFTIFASGGTGSFSSISPATPGTGLAWDTSSLNSSGIIKVVAAAASITPTPSTLSSPLTTTYGKASISQSVSISVSGLSDSITATAPAGLQVSSDGTTFGGTATISQTGGTLYVRLATNAPVSGSPYDNKDITLVSGSSAADVYTSGSGNTVTAKTLTISGATAQNKRYDGNTTATVSGTLVGVTNNDSLTLAGNFVSAGPGSGISVTNYVTGAAAGNYSLTQPGVTASIFASPTWNGGSATDNNWSDAANWSGLSLLPANDQLVFDGSTRLNTTNNTTAGTTYSNITFNATAGAFVLNGNPITLAGGNITNNSSNPQTIDLGLNFSTNLTLNGGTGGLVIGGGLTNTFGALGYTTLTLAGAGTLTNLLNSANSPGGTNLIAMNSSSANWTLVDNATSAAMTNPWAIAVNNGTFNFGSASSAPALTLTTPNGTPSDNVVGAVSGATGTFNMNGGTLTTASRLNTATAANATGIINQVGGTLNINNMFQGANGSSAGEVSSVNVSGGTMNVAGVFFLANRGTGSLTVSGAGQVFLTTLDVSRGLQAGTKGTVNLNGGTLAVDYVGTATANTVATNGSETATFNFNGGTLQARQNNATFITQSGFGGPAAGSNIVLNLIVKSGGAIIDTAGFIVTNTLALQHDSTLGGTADGGLTKLGAGVLALNAANAYTGNTTISAGTLLINGSISTGAVTNYSGATFGGSGTIGGNVGFASGAMATNNQGSPLTINGTLTLNNNTIYVSTPSALGAGNYALINYTAAGSSGSFNATPVISGAGLAANTTNYVTTAGGQVKLVVLNTYTVTYNANGLSGSAPTDANAYTNGATVTVASGSLTVPAGYHFAGWYDAASGGTLYGASLAGGTFAMPGNNLTLYAQVAPNTYTVTFDGNGGGTPSPASKLVTYASTYGTLATVTRTGYAFIDWYDAASGGSPVTSSTAVAITGGQTLYAHWTINQYTVSFESNGGSAVASQSVNYNATATQPTDPTKTGYTFAGWYADSGLTTAFSFATAITANTTLYAKWTLNNHPPVAAEMNVLRTPGEAVLIALSDLATNWSDADADLVQMTAFNVTTTNGVSLTALNLTTDGGGYVTSQYAYLGYTNTQPPLTNLNDRFTYSIADGHGGTNVGTVNIVVNPFVPGQVISGQQTTNSITNTTFTVTYYGIPGYTYLLERSTNLTDWADIATNTIGPKGVTNVIDNFGDLGFVHPSSAYYRVGWKVAY